MKESRRATGRSRSRPAAPAGTSLSLLHSLQSENETLRSDLLRAQQSAVSLQQQLDVLRSKTGDIVRDAVAVKADQVRALEGRCHLLAERLVAFRRDGQLSESARVTFLLRSQLEERRFLERGLVSMLSELTDEASPALVEADAEAHTGTLYRLVMAASNALLEHTAAAKLEKARTRLTLEHATAVLAELHSAIQNATRAAFEAARHASNIEEALVTPGPGQEGLPALTATSSLRGGFLTPSPSRRPTGDHSHHTQEGAERQSSSTYSATTLTAPPTALSLSEELEWVCDVLKACLQGVREVGSDVATAVAEMQAPLPRNSGVGDAVSSRPKPPPLSAAATPAMNALLRSFLEDLTAIKTKAAAQQEAMARQLAQEVDKHFASTQQYEERIQLLELECARLLRYAEHVAEDSAKWLPASPSNPVPPQPSSVPLQGVSGAAFTAGVAAAAATPPAPATAEDADEDNRVTPERHTATPRAERTSFIDTPRHQTPPRKTKQTSTDNTAADAKQRQQRAARSPRAAPPTARRTRYRDVDPAAEASSVADKEVPRRSPFRESSFVAHPASPPPKLLLSPRREPAVVPSRPTSPSAAAGALWSYYRSRNTSRIGDVSVAADSPQSRPRQRFMSPVPPPPPPPTRRSTAAAAATGTMGLAAPRGDTSPWRRSVTAPMPPLRSAPTATPADTLATSLSSVSSASDLRSTPLRAAHSLEGKDGLVSSRVRARAVALSSSLSPATSMVRPQMAAAAAAHASPPLSPPCEASASSTPSSRFTNRTRLSQRLYDEAAADFFSDDGGHGSSAATPLPRAEMRPRTSRSLSPFLRGSEGYRVRTPSPRRPLHIGLRVLQGGRPAAQDSVQGTSEHRRSSHHADPPSPTPLPPLPAQRERGIHVLTITSRYGQGESDEEATPVAWRRIKAEAASQPQQKHQQQQLGLASPDDGSSYLFGTPREVSWMDV